MPAEDIEAIKQLKARYFRFMDTKQWSEMRQVFTDDVRVDTTQDGTEVVEGADAFVGPLSEMLADVITVHHGHMPEIELTSDTTATGVWAMEDHLWWPEGSPPKLPARRTPRAATRCGWAWWGVAAAAPAPRCRL